MARKPKAPKDIESLTHDEARRINNPTAEMASLYEQQSEMLGDGEAEMSLPRDRPLAEGEVRARDEDLDPQIVWNGAKISLTPGQVAQLQQTGTVEIGDAQLVWRGKDRQDWSDLVVNAPPLYIQEKVHPKAIIDELKRKTKQARDEDSDAPDLFADFNGLDDPEARAEFYQHSMHWQNRFILGDSLQVMASLAEREAMKGRVQAIYFDPPYGIKFNSNWQVSTQSNRVADGKVVDVTREPEQVKAFRDTWKDGIHSYLTYLRDRLSVARELLIESGSMFVQIGDENVHRVRALMDEVFGDENFVAMIYFQTAANQNTNRIQRLYDCVLWYRKSANLKFREVFRERELSEEQGVFTAVDDLSGEKYKPAQIKSAEQKEGIHRAGRLTPSGTYWKRMKSDFPFVRYDNVWKGTVESTFSKEKVYVVQTNAKVIERCILMSTDPGDLVLDPTCGSGTTATVAEQWGRRWITIDTSRVALALARTRLMSAKYPYYLLADSAEGRAKEGELTGRIPAEQQVLGDIRQGFVYERVPHITLANFSDNARIDDIWENWQEELEPLRAGLNAEMGFLPSPLMGEGGSRSETDEGDAETVVASSSSEDTPSSALRAPSPTGGEGKSEGWQDWQIPRDLDDWMDSKEGKPLAGLVSAKVRDLHAAWWKARIARQTEIDEAIAQAADVELLYDRPYEDRSKVRVAGPFTVESLSPHRVVTARDDSLGEELDAARGTLAPGVQAGPRNMPEIDFGDMVLEHLRSAGVHQQARADTIHFSTVTPWPGDWLCAEAHYLDGEDVERRAGILVGPEFGTLTRSQITAAAREASESRFDSLIACAFNFEAQAADLNRLGPLPILKARMNPDLHMADDLKNTGKGNLFVVFGEPDVQIHDAADGQLQVQVKGVDVFDPSTGEIRSDGVDGIAAWFIDTDYNEESFFVRHAYFLGANDPYKSLKTALKAEIDEDAWQTLYSDTSRPFDRPNTGRIAVKVINHFGDEVLKVFGV